MYNMDWFRAVFPNPAPGGKSDLSISAWSLYWADELNLIRKSLKM